MKSNKTDDQSALSVAITNATASAARIRIKWRAHTSNGLHMHVS